MEAYCRWDDKESGINPFFPEYLKYPSNKVLKYIRMFIGILLVVVKIPILMMLFLLYILSIPTAALKKLFGEIILSIQCKLILKVCGCFYKEEFSNPKHDKTQTVFNPKTTEIIISNHQSFFDILYLTFRCFPSFYQVKKDGTLVPRNFYEILLDSLLSRSEYENYKSITLNEAVEYMNGPIVIFPEGCKTNGKAVIDFLPFLKTFKGENLPKIHIMVFKYSYQYFSPSHSARSLIRHFILLCYQITCVMLVYDLHGDCIPSKPKETSIEEYTNDLRQIMSRMMKVKCVSLNNEDYTEFHKYYSERESGKKVKSKSN